MYSNRTIPVVEFLILFVEDLQKLYGKNFDFSGLETNFIFHTITRINENITVLQRKIMSN